MAGLVIVSGPNFSGRTKLLQEATYYQDPFAEPSEPRAAIKPPGIRCAYVGVEGTATYSGIARTVGSELAIHGRLAGGGTSQQQSPIFSWFSERGLLDRNPFKLSGGEQAMLALGTACAIEPDVLAVDNTLEQLHPDVVSVAIESLKERAASDILLCDNRLSERNSLPQHSQKHLVKNDGARYALANAAPITLLEPVSLELSNIRFAYDRGPSVFDKLSLRLEPGRIYHLCGPNGAGKSTLAKLIAGLLKLKEGTIRSQGVAVRPWKKPGRIAAYHFQNPDHQLFRHTVAAELAASLNTTPGGWSLGHVHLLLAAFGLSSLAEIHPFDLPYVLRKRVALAAACALVRPWLILDEPTLGQDDETALRFAEMLRSYANRGRGILLISHSRVISKHLDALEFNICK
jgi:energy-coupling factor transport system ATP-binding protein